MPFVQYAISAGAATTVVYVLLVIAYPLMNLLTSLLLHLFGGIESIVPPAPAAPDPLDASAAPADPVALTVPVARVSMTAFAFPSNRETSDAPGAPAGRANRTTIAFAFPADLDALTTPTTSASRNTTARASHNTTARATRNTTRAIPGASPVELAASTAPDVHTADAGAADDEEREEEDD